MILDGFISSGERKPPHFHSHPIRLLKPTPCIIHLHGHSFLLTWKSLDMRAGLLHRRLFERHHEMWQDIIQSCNMPRLSGVCSAVFLWIPQREREGGKKRDNLAQISFGCLSDFYTVFLCLWQSWCQMRACRSCVMVPQLDLLPEHLSMSPLTEVCSLWFCWCVCVCVCLRQVIRDFWLRHPEWQLSSITAFIMTQAGKL